MIYIYKYIYIYTDLKDITIEMDLNGYEKIKNATMHAIKRYWVNLTMRSM